VSAPLFRSVDHGLRTAFDFEHYGDLSSARLGRSSKGSGRGGMSHADWSVQARQIRDMVARFDLDGMCYVLAFYARGKVKEFATKHLLSMPAVQARMPASRVAGEALLRRYVSNGEGRRTLRDIATEAGVSHTTVMRAEYALKAALSALFADTEAAVFTWFVENELAPTVE
jgi:hypothetical protein